MDEEIELEIPAYKDAPIRFDEKIRGNQVVVTIPEQKIVFNFERLVRKARISAETKIYAHLLKRMSRKEWELDIVKRAIPDKLEWFKENGEVRRFIVENKLYEKWLVELITKKEGNEAMEMLKGVLWKMEDKFVYRFAGSYDSQALKLYYNGKTFRFYKNNLVFKIFSLLKGKIVDYEFDSEKGKTRPIFYSPESWLGLITKLDTKKKKKVLEALRKGEPLEKIKALVITNSFLEAS